MRIRYIFTGLCLLLAQPIWAQSQGHFTVRGSFGPGKNPFGSVLASAEAQRIQESIRDTLEHQLFTSVPEDLVFEVVFGRYHPMGWAVEFRALDRRDGVILAAWANQNHREGCYFLTEWILDGRLGVNL